MGDKQVTIPVDVAVPEPTAVAALDRAMGADEPEAFEDYLCEAIELDVTFKIGLDSDQYEHVTVCRRLATGRHPPDAR